MALGDGIRRNIAHVTQVERDRFIAAVRQLDMSRIFPDGVSYWDKQDQIHQATHVHGGASFLPWHRELCNRFEEMLREVDPQISLHYWDWTTDPRATPDGAGGTVDLFSNTFMGSASGRAGVPLDTFDNNNVFTGSRADTGDPADPPQVITRDVAGGAPAPSHPTVVDPDATLVTWGDGAPMADQYLQFHERIEGAGVRNHDAIHGYIGGTIGFGHTAFEDPFVFLLHSNVDRLWAMWQTQPGKEWRLDPAQVYGIEGSSTEINENMEPWAGASGMRPWAPPENQQVARNSTHPSVVFPPCYATLPTYPAVVTQETFSLNFNDVPEGETAARAIVFSAVSCHDVHLSISAGPTVLTGPGGTSFGTFPAPLGTSVTIPHIAGSTPPIGRIWISYRGTNALDTATGTVTVHCDETGQDFTIPIAANTIARPTVAVELVLDQSGSMDWLAGIDATTRRIDILHQAATQFVQLAQDTSRQGDAVGMVSFDHNAYPGVAMTTNNGTGLDLAPVITAINALHPAGATSIGDGVALGRSALNPVTGFMHKAMVVFTDGLENSPQYIADVMGSINDRTFAIGLGTAQQVSIGALTALANGTGGRLLLSGQLSPAIDDYFRLSKFFMQVLAGVTNVDIVTDPSGYISPGMKVRIPFQLNETDIESTVILLTDMPGIRFRIETPAGEILDPAGAGAIGATYATGTNMLYYRFTLPLPIGGKPAQAGTWYALLEVDRRIYRRRTRVAESQPGAAQHVHGIRYNLSVQAHSNLRMQAMLSQDSLQPGAALTLHAALSEYGIPVEHRAFVRAELERPDHSQTTITLSEVEPGRFEGSTVAGLQGVYRFRLIASGRTLRGLTFTREELLSGAVVLGGDSPPPASDPSRGTLDTQLCDLLQCLLQPEALGRLLQEHQVDPRAVQECVDQWCKQRTGDPPLDVLREREGTTLPVPQSPPPGLAPSASKLTARRPGPARKSKTKK